MAEVRRMIDAWRCRRLAARLVDYADGTLPPAERAAVEWHVARCAWCAAAVAALRDVPAALAGAEVEPPAEFWRRQRAQIMRAVDAVALAAPRAPACRGCGAGRQFAPRFDLRIALPFAAAAAIAIAGYLSLRPPDTPPRTVASLIDALGPDDVAALAEVTGLFAPPDDLAPGLQVADADVAGAAFEAGWLDVEDALLSADEGELDFDDVEELKEIVG